MYHKTTQHTYLQTWKIYINYTTNYLVKLFTQNIITKQAAALQASAGDCIAMLKSSACNATKQLH